MNRLNNGDVHIWTMDPAQLADASDIRACVALLSPEELGRYRRFRFERHRHTFLSAHALVRHALSRYFDLAPQTWTFTTNQYGKPAIANPDFEHGLTFNLSHTDGRIVCAVTIGREIGIDVESHQRRRINLRIADRFFASMEADALRRLAPGDQPRRFLELWTLKEAYIKARGMGLAIPLRRFAFDGVQTGKPSIRFFAGIDDNPASWRFQIFDAVGNYVVALAVAATADDALNVEFVTATLGASGLTILAA